MKQTTRHIRKQFRITYQEEKQISELMKEQGLDNFSDFLRQRISQSKDQSREVEQWFSLWQTKKLEQISRDIYKMSVLSENAQQVTAEHVRIILTCVQELIGEVEKSVTLSEEFREKYRL
ncbi:SAG1252 family conjugative relaxosome accessory protein [Lactococcus ileimucosae]|uniref:SAG1252 family conjugative relaxosome accessory protein n=1 Tax=Lactococcus ileimucosae TaxID=2941329 RepID=UPI0035140C84